MGIDKTIQLTEYEYWQQQVDKLEKEYDLTVKERRSTKWMKENSERINELFQFRMRIGMNTFFGVGDVKPIKSTQQFYLNGSNWK